MGSLFCLLLRAGVDPLEGKRQRELHLVQLPFLKYSSRINAAIWLDYVTMGGRLVLRVIRKEALLIL